MLPNHIVGGVLIVLGIIISQISIAYFNLRARSLPGTPQAQRRHEFSKRNALLIDAGFVAAGFYVILRG